MESFTFLNYYNYTIILFTIFVLWRVFNLSLLIVQLYYGSGGKNWNSEINPFKLIFCLILLIIFFGFLYPIYKSQSDPINLYEQSEYFIVLLIIYGSIEYVIQNPTGKYLTKEKIVNSTNKSKKNDKIQNENVYKRVKENDLKDCEIDNLEPNIIDDDCHKNTFENIEKTNDLNFQPSGNIFIETPLKGNMNIKELNNLKNRSIVPLLISREEIIRKCAELKENYNLYCDESDLGDLLLGKKLNKKILFVNKNRKAPEINIKEYLALLDVLVNGNLVNYRSKRKNLDIIEWIDANFDYSKIKGTKLISKNISDYRDSVEAQEKGNFR